MLDKLKAMQALGSLMKNKEQLAEAGAEVDVDPEAGVLGAHPALIHRLAFGDLVLEGNRFGEKPPGLPLLDGDDEYRSEQQGQPHPNRAGDAI